MRWGLKTKEAAAITLLILGVVVTMLILHLAQLTRVVVEETQRQAELIAKQIVAQSARVLARAPDVEPHAALRGDAELRHLLEASVGYSPHLLYAFIADAEGRVILHSESGKEGERLIPQAPLAELLSVNPMRRLDALLSRGRTYETPVAISLDRKPFGSVRLGFSSSFLRRELNEAVTQSLVLAGLALPAAWLVALFMANLVLRPIGQLARDLGRMRRGELDTALSAPAGISQEDELGELAAQLQLLSQQLQADRLRVLSEEAPARELDSIKTLQSLVSYSAKLAALGRLTSGVAHEVKNPLNAMMIHLELVRTRLAAAHPDLRGVRESLDIIGAEIRRLDHVVNGFLRFFRSQELALKPVDLNVLAHGVAALLEAEWKPMGIRFTLALDTTCPRVSGDEELLRQALINIVVNGCQAMPGGGEVTLETKARGEWAALSVTDQGPGIAPEDRERIFALYYTTKPQGSGIGLSLVYRIVQMHDGAVDVEAPESGQGTRMTIRLPVR
ncbi:MAG TPA: ATP-binding protein [Methylomirabilota bacterium]|nr:ATP-binding protein [Methylomirabilota bacterium]